MGTACTGSTPKLPVHGEGVLDLSEERVEVGGLDLNTTLMLKSLYASQQYTTPPEIPDQFTNASYVTMSNCYLSIHSQN